MKLILVAVTAMAIGCGPVPTPTPNPTPTPDTRQTCRQLGWDCGIDDYGSTCGYCSVGTCSDGTCRGGTMPPTCSCGGRVCGIDNCGNSCGTCSMGQTCNSGTCAASMSTTMPTSHVLASGNGYFGSVFGAPFFLPVTTTVCFSATSSAGDGFNVGIWTATNWSLHITGGSGARVYAQHVDISTATDCVTNLPAGSYHLGFDCTNWIQNCAVTYAVTATY